MTGAYSGVRVLDFTQGLAGPLACALLADHAAETIKIEPPGGDRMKDDPGYWAFNRGKTIIRLDLSAPTDLAAAHALIADADVAVFDAGPGMLKPLGLDAAALTGAHPRLIHVWTPPYGTQGRWSDLPADHVLLSALTGIAFRQSAYRDQPVHLVAPLAYYGQALNAAAATGAALYERTHSGRGQAVLVSGLHGAAQISGPVSGPMRMGRMGGWPIGGSASYRLYQCGDGEWLFLGTLFTHFFMKALDAMGVLAAARSGRSLPDLMEMRFLDKSRDDWVRILVANDVPCGPVGTREAFFAGQTVRDNRLRADFQHPELGRVSVPASPVLLSATPAHVTTLPVLVDWSAVPPRPRAASPVKRARAAASVSAPPLSGVKVLDLGTVIAGAYGATILASYGADVIKIESPEGDPWRSAGLGFGAHNRGKRALCIDLKSRGGRDLFLELVRGADVVLDNFRGGVRKRLGIDYEALRAVNPRIISCTITAYGADGPRAGLPGFDPLLQAEGGLMAGQGGDGEEPVLHTIPVNDVGSAIVSAFGIVTALHARELTGEGQEVITSLAATSVTLQTGEITAFEGRAPPCPGGRDCIGSSAVRRFFPCADGWIAIACTSAAHVARLALCLGDETLGSALDARALAAAPTGELARAIGQRFARRARADLLETLLDAGVPAALALRGEEAFDDPWLWANGVFETYDNGHLGSDITGVRAFAEWSRTKARFARPTPELGEHTIDVLREFGVADPDILALLRAGVVFAG